MLESITSIITGLVSNELFIKYGLIGLLLNGLLSSVIPIPTELTVSALLLGGQDRVLIFIYLLVGSVAGGFVAYYVGYGGGKVFRLLYKKPNKKYEEKAEELMKRYNWTVLLLVCPWIPVVGDIIPTLAGARKYDFRKYALAMTAGKTIKIIAIVFFLGWLLPFFFKA